MFEMVSWCLLAPVALSSCFRVCIRLLSGRPWRPGRHVDANLLFSWHRKVPAWGEMHPPTPACLEIIEPRSVPDCMLSWCCPNLFHSLMRGIWVQEGDWLSSPRWDDVRVPAVISMSHGDWMVRVICLLLSIERHSYGKALRGFFSPILTNIILWKTEVIYNTVRVDKQLFCVLLSHCWDNLNHVEYLSFASVGGVWHLMETRMQQCSLSKWPFKLLRSLAILSTELNLSFNNRSQIHFWWPCMKPTRFPKLFHVWTSVCLYWCTWKTLPLRGKCTHPKLDERKNLASSFVSWHLLCVCSGTSSFCRRKCLAARSQSTQAESVQMRHVEPNSQHLLFPPCY